MVSKPWISVITGDDEKIEKCPKETESGGFVT